MKKMLIAKYPKVTDDTVISNLSIRNQFRLLSSKLSNNQAQELDANKKMTVSRMKRKASLTKFLTNATKKLEDKTAESVTVSLVSDYLNYLDSVTDPVHGLGRYYKFEIMNKDELEDRIPGVRYKIVLKISVRR